MQIRFTTDAEYTRKKAQARRPAGAGDAERTKRTPSDSDFLRLLDEVLPPAAGVDSQETLRELWAELPAAEREFLERQSAGNLERYKELVRAIASQTLRTNTRVEQMKDQARLSKQEIQRSVIRIIDEKIQKMAMILQSRNNSAFALLSTMEDIRGLLLDLQS